MAATQDRDFNDVFIFTRVVEAQSFTAAAKALGLPTSSVSRRVSRLEESLGVRLLSRTTRRLSLTDAGQLYYERGVRAFSSLEEAEDQLKQAQSSPRGRVRVTAPVEQGLLMAVVAPFLREYPEVRVDLELTNRRVNVVEEGFDVAVYAGPVANTSLVARKLMDSPSRIVASPDYLKRRGVPQTLEALGEHDCVIFGAASAGGAWSLRGQDGEVTKVKVRGRIAVNHLQAVRAAAVSGLGVAVIPELACMLDLAEGKLVPVLAGHEPPDVPIWAMYQGGGNLAPAVRAFIEYLRTHFADAARAIMTPAADA